MEIEKNVKENYENDIQILAEIILSIETKNAIEFLYTKELEFSKSRKILAHNLYWNPDNTKVILDGFQITGDSKTGILKSFKQFDCKYIKNVFILDEKFDIQDGYNGNSIRYKNSILGII
jgi:hypothetical protein